MTSSTHSGWGIRSGNDATKSSHSAIMRDGEDEDDSPLCVRKLTEFVMTEADFKRKMYDLVLLVLLLYVALVFPWLLSFTYFRMRVPGEECIDHDVGSFLKGVDSVVTVFFWVDLFLSFFFSYVDRDGNEITNFVSVAQKYLSGAFWVNLIACVPAEVMEPLVELLPIDPGGCAASTGSAGAHQATRLARLQRITRLARLARLVRVVRLSQVLKKWAQTLHMVRSFRLANMLFLLLWLIHFQACLLYLVASLHTEHENTWVGRRVIDNEGMTLLQADPWVQWAHGMYFVLTIFTTVGFGDMSAFTVGEILIVCTVMLVGTIVHSILIGEVINLVQEVDKETVYKKNRVELVEAFGEHTRLPEPTVDRLTTFINALHVRGTYNRNDMCKFLTSVALPRELMGELPEYLFEGSLLKNKFVNICALNMPHGMVPPRFSLILSTMLTSQRFCHNDLIYKKRDHAFNMYLIMSGIFARVAEVTSSSNDGDGESKDAPSIDSAMLCDPQEKYRKYSSILQTRRMTARCSSLHQSTCAWTGASATPSSDSTQAQEWVQLDLNSEHIVCGVRLKGHPTEKEWVSAVQVKVSSEPFGPWFTVVKFSSNNACSDNDTEKLLDFPGLHARYVRVEAVDWVERCSMRVAVMAKETLLYPYQLYGKHNFFGEEALLQKPRVDSVRCERKGEVLLLNKSSLFGPSGGDGLALLTEFPQFHRPLRSACIMREVTRKRLLKVQGGQQKDSWALAAQLLANAWRQRKTARLPLGESEMSGTGIELPPRVKQKRRTRTLADDDDKDMGTPVDFAAEPQLLGGGSPGGNVETMKILSLLEKLTKKVDTVSKDLGTKVDAVSREVREASGKIKRLEDAIQESTSSV